MEMQFDPNRRLWMKGGWHGGGHEPVLPAGSQVVGVNDAINKAGRQRMLSQRMAKAWLATGQGGCAAGRKNHGRPRWPCSIGSWSS